jgi:hypothetical protein
MNSTLFIGRFTSNHASPRQDEVSTTEKHTGGNLRGYDAVIRPASVRTEVNKIMTRFALISASFSSTNPSVPADGTNFVPADLEYS